MENVKRKDVVGVCLDTFVAKGLAETTSRDLSAALELQSGGLYYYFKTKDEAVLACAQEAALRLEQNLILPCLLDLHDPDRLFDKLEFRAKELAPTMRFFSNVCATEKYREKLVPTLEGLAKRYEHYSAVFAKQLGCSQSELEPYFYTTVSAVSNYMIFGGAFYISKQLELVKNELYELCREEADVR